MTMLRDRAGVARLAHNQKVAGSNPAPATIVNYSLARAFWDGNVLRRAIGAGVSSCFPRAKKLPYSRCALPLGKLGAVAVKRVGPASLSVLPFFGAYSRHLRRGASQQSQSSIDGFVECGSRHSDIVLLSSRHTADADSIADQCDLRCCVDVSNVSFSHECSPDLISGRSLTVYFCSEPGGGASYPKDGLPL
jgi:hypothetical protein